MVGWETVLVVLAALFVGAMLPVLLQLYVTLASVRKELRKSSKHATRVFDEAHETLVQASALVKHISSHKEDFSQLAHSVNEVTRMVNQLKSTITIASAAGAAIGPAVQAFVKSMHDCSAEQCEEQSSDGDSEKKGEHHEQLRETSVRC
ncbi:MAG: hypothetical protein IPJ88_04540 [Myxococcales bacterium]|nr:MAG: hypothetical protein IPJ88_04540 [Myxococcales bacterium]